MSTLGFVGLGTMGRPMVERLLDAGYEVHGHNRTVAKAQALIDKGLHWCDTPREVAEKADIVISMLSDDDALEAVAGGDGGIIAGLGSGAIYVDMSTVSPSLSRRLAEQARKRGAQMLDAPVAGSVPQVEQGKLTIMVGGDETAFETVSPILGTWGKPCHIGTNGQGLLLKLAINISLAAQMIAFSEGVLLAERGGIDRELALEIMAGSAIGSPMLKARAPFLKKLPEQSWFTLDLLHKDIRLALDAGGQLKAPLPSAHAADETLEQAHEAGFGREDIAAVFKALDEGRAGSD
ncbi:MAG: NAD(P)-dependent oxidoreductase [Gammaproteobacteria bacterium]